MIADGADNVGGMPIGELLMYYVYFFFAWYIIGGTFRHFIENAIRKGDLSIELLKPVFPYAKVILQEQGWKTFGLLTAIPFLLASTLVVSSVLSFEISFNPSGLLIATPTIVLGSLIFGFSQFIMGNIAMWTTKTGGVEVLWQVFSTVFGGWLAPLSIMPEIVQNVGIYLPFKYIFAYPIAVMNYEMSGDDALFAFFMQIAWTVVMYIVAKAIYIRGLRKYESFGN